MAQPNEHKAIINEVLLAKSMLDWRQQPEMSLRRIFRINCANHFAPNQHVNTEDLLKFAVASSISNLLRQTFVANYEYLRHNIDDKMTTKLKNLKSSTSTSSNNLNTTKFMDAIRQSLVHNDINMEIPNRRLNNEFNIEINFKGNTFTFNFLQLHQIMNEFLELKKEHAYMNFAVQAKDLYNAVDKGRLTVNSVKQYILLYNKDGSRATLDNYQCKALYNLLTPVPGVAPSRHIDILLDHNCFILQKLLPCKHNAGHISYINNMTFRNLLWLDKHFINREDYINHAYDFEKRVELTDEKNDGTTRGALVEFINYDSIALESALISNALFTLFSISTPEQLQGHISKDIDAKRLRNSLMHGRYYYDNANGFEFYDGRTNDNLEHIASLSINDIMKTISSFVSKNLEESKTTSI